MKLMQSMRVPALLLILVTALSACGDKNGEDKKATQVAAKVNKDEITVHQINYELGKLGNLPPAQAKQAANTVLKGLVEQQLLMQKAIDSKVDREPAVVQRLEAYRRQVLAEAYLERVTSTAAEPAAAEISAYYAKNPALFSDRRIYRLQELSVPVTAENVESVKAKLAESRDIGAFAEWLKSVNIQARAVQSVKPAEQLPLELLPRLHAAKEGQAIALATPNSLNIVFVTGYQSQPVTEEQAKPVISRYLVNAKKRELVEAELKKLREAGKIEYLGDYVEVGKIEAKPAAK
ncbi:MAG: peptidyl-prolyl cis-trans isomerase, EpsD family [Hydrogenophilaceae bacterium]|nr:peptidyl-prolyl cis-trans isomerase, EpsD family [Hydrogenophilaceae bacterium]